MKALRRLLRSFRCAGAGVWETIRTERNMRIHLCAVVFVVICGIWQGLAPAHWALELICCGAVMGLELVNTAIENLCDRVSRERDEQIRRCKDAAAGAVLVMAAVSAAVWLLLLLGTPAYRQRFAGHFAGSAAGWLIGALWLICSLVFSLGLDNKTDKGDKK